MHVVLALGGNVSILDKLKGKNKAIVTLWQRASAPHSKIVRVTKLELQHCTMIQWFKTNCDVQMNIVKTIFVSLTTPWGEMVKFGLSLACLLKVQALAIEKCLNRSYHDSQSGITKTLDCTKNLN